MGEFGTGDNDDAWGKIIQYLEESDSDWSYWAIDGYSVFYLSITLDDCISLSGTALLEKMRHMASSRVTMSQLGILGL